MRPDSIAAWATGTGIGLATFIVTWIVMNRLTSLWLPLPQAPIVALISAIVLGIAVTVHRGATLSHRVKAQIE